ncbi:CRE-PFD-6 protein [Caenorhabditis remanei]|uniref:Probable prefoldin subunit 6 n=2 Tax=Caenorhabditis remanei TaxID=31234 RepID=E3NJ90_CAERE|nr:CRE-PFD-6 protein [Caenorhabditis remanei]
MADMQKFEEEVNKLKTLEKDREKYFSSRQEMEMRLTESRNVKAELDLMDTDSKVYKLIGAVLVRQDLEEARSTVEKRLEFIESEIKRVEASIADVTKKSSDQRDKVMNIQKTFQMMAQQAQQAQAAQKK